MRNRHESSGDQLRRIWVVGDSVCLIRAPNERGSGRADAGCLSDQPNRLTKEARWQAVLELVQIQH